MDPHTGQVYSPDEIPHLPKEVQKRLVPVDPPKPVKRNKRKTKSYAMPSKDSDISKRRAANKRAKLARRKNRK